MTYDEWITGKMAALRERLGLPEAEPEPRKWSRSASMVPDSGKHYPCATAKRFSQLYIPPEEQERNQ